MRIEKEGVRVLFACKCMTYDESETKFWYHGEYEPIDMETLGTKLESHRAHCPFNSELSMIGASSNEA